MIGILFALAVPSFNVFVERSYFSLIQARLLNALTMTKAMAISRQQVFLLCGSHDGAHCDGDWNANWLLVESSTHRVFHVFDSEHYQVTVHFLGNFQDREGVSFNAQGGCGKQGRFSLTLHAYHSDIILIETGRMRVDSES
jgi:Tfp pilus assembly protein FimT